MTSSEKSIRQGRPRYVSLATFRRSGREVRTPVWIAGDGKRLYVYTNGKSGKVKRLRANPRVRLAPCDMRGRVHGPWIEASARVVEDPRAMDPGLALLERKYGWQMRLARTAARMSGRWADRVVLEIEAGDVLD